MLLSEIFEQLTYGELSQLKLGGSNGEGILSANYPAVVAHINLGMTELYKKFPLSVKEVSIQQYASISTYFLNPIYGINSGTTEPIKYIIDSAGSPFVDTVFKIEEVLDTDELPIKLNDRNTTGSVFTPQYNSIKLPAPNDTDITIVRYRSGHTKIDVAGLDPETKEVELPIILLEALLLYVAARVYAGAPSLDGSNESQIHLAKFAAACNRVKDEDLINEENYANTKLEIKGWA